MNTLPPDSSKLVLSCTDVVKSYISGSEVLTILNQLNLQAGAGEMIAITGASGSGKSTLLNLVGGLDQADSGEVSICGESIGELNENQRAKLRNRYLGFVYQFHHLLPEFNAIENVALPRMLGGEKLTDAKVYALELLDSVGLADRATHRPSELSGGERQRVAIARSLVTKPACVLMDEPTGNLDQANAEMVMDLICGINQATETTIILVTHDAGVANRMQRKLDLVDGRLLASETNLVSEEQA